MRETRLRAFLEEYGLGTATRTALAGDASARRYERITTADRTRILMDAPPPESVAQFIKVANLLKQRGYSPPGIIGANTGSGFLLLEDLGDDLIARLLERGGDEKALYGLAVDFLVDQPRHPAPVDLPVFNADYMHSQNEMFTDWYMTEKLCRSLSVDEITTYRSAWGKIIPDVFMAPDVLLLRDFHAENLLFLEGREGLKALGLLDFQDAMQGPPAYDLVSLLQDARRDVAPDIEQEIRDRYIKETGLPEEPFLLSYAILGAHRAMRILGIFTRLAGRDGKTGYLKLIPRVTQHLATNLTHPGLAPLRSWLDNIIGSKGTFT